MSDEQKQGKSSFLASGIHQAVPPPPPADLKRGKSRTPVNGNGDTGGTTSTQNQKQADIQPPAQEVSTSAPPISPVEVSPAPIHATSMQSRTQYPEGTNFDNRYEAFNTFVLSGMKDLIKDLRGRTGESMSDLTTIAYIALFEEYGYDMTKFKEQLQGYYHLREMQEKLRKFEEAQEKNKARRKKKD